MGEKGELWQPEEGDRITIRKMEADRSEISWLQNLIWAEKRKETKLVFKIEEVKSTTLPAHGKQPRIYEVRLSHNIGESDECWLSVSYTDLLTHFRPATKGELFKSLL